MRPPPGTASIRPDTAGGLRLHSRAVGERARRKDHDLISGRQARADRRDTRAAMRDLDAPFMRDAIADHENCPASVATEERALRHKERIVDFLGRRLGKADIYGFGGASVTP
jgi:hypothetical protein